MNAEKSFEIWLKGPVENIPPLLQPVAHALLQANAEVTRLMKNFPREQLWVNPAGVASVAFHLQHITGVVDRLFTYARAEMLSPAQLMYLENEGMEAENISVKTLLDNLNSQVKIALQQLSTTKETTLTDVRNVGRKKLPSTVMGLLFHAAEHTMRHLGQVMVTVKCIMAGKNLSSSIQNK